MITPPLKQSFNSKRIRRRIIEVSLGFLLVFAILAARAFELHLTDNTKLRNLAENQYQRKVVVAPKRGNILDTHEDTLAIDIQVDSVYAVPSVIQDSQSFAKALAPALSLSENKISDRIQDKNKKFVWLKRRLSPQESTKLKELKLEGIGILPEYKRFYPNGVLAANILGAVGYDATALSGLEMTYDDKLKSVDPPVLVEQDAKGRSYEPYALSGLEHPNDIILTIDKTIQYIVERELKTEVQKSQAIGGIAVVLDVKTGQVLAMATQPTFDPNEYYKYEFKQWRNRAVTDIYEPGSIFKAFTASAALETGVFDLKQTLNCENGSMQVGKFTIHDHHGYGNLNLSDIIKYSSNICSYKLAQKVGKKRYYDLIRAFGFGHKTDVGVPGEVSGLMASYENLGTLQLGTMAFGQGISTTPIQIASAYAAIANGGALMKPYMIKEIRDSKGQTLQTFTPQVVRQVISEKTAHTVAQLLETVVEKGGTGTAARLENYRVAGKTGTAQKVMEGQKGYAKNKYFASFVGFAPSRDPRLVVLVSIDEPKGDYYGGLVSAPVFREIMGQSLTYLKVPADQTMETGVATGKSLNKKNDEKPAKNKKQEEPKDVSENDIPVEVVPGGTIPSAEETAERIVPNFKGLSVREALREAQSKNLKIEIKGSGICNHQEPKAGLPISDETSVMLECQPPI